ncbi:MAG: ATP-binding cassette domain-containing protein, partial [Dehalococcoidia bacterium]
MSDPKLAVRDLRVLRDGRPLLDVPSLEVRREEVLVIVGPNGAGKSTLLCVLALLELPGAGQVLFEGRAVDKSLLAYRRRMAVVFQEPLLLDATVDANVRSGLILRGVPHNEQDRRLAEWLGRFGIAHLARRSARTLSGGEAQRVSL